MSCSARQIDLQVARFAEGNGVATANLAVSQTEVITLASLPVGARLIVKCKKDWRTASVSQVTPERVKIQVHSPRGGTYRITRPPDAPLTLDGAIPLLLATDDECHRATWLSGLVVYDPRW